MKLPTRRPPEIVLPGLTGVARVDRHTRTLIGRLRPGDIAIVEHLDMDRATAQQLVDAEVSAVLNAAPFISGRYPTQGPSVLVEAGIPLVDSVGVDVFAAVKDGREVRLHEGELFVGDSVVASGEILDGARLKQELGAARGGMTTQLENFTHNSTEFLRREEQLLLHGRGAPKVGTKMADRSVAVCVAGPELADELRTIKRYLNEQHPVLIAVDSAADVLRERGLRADVIVLSGPDTAQATETRVSAKALKSAKDVVVLVERGSGKTPMESLERLGIHPQPFETSASAEDAALMLAALGHASLVIGVGVHATLADFLDRQRGGLASTFLARLQLGPRLVDAKALPELYSGRLRPWHMLLLVLACLIALAAAIAVTPVGQEWFDDLGDLIPDLYDRVKGFFS
ncbi:MAG TPA: putative cytokinetic ring protein SteA [Nocardioides sp.]|jgi:uncharacterized membrane-anchored protein